MIWAPVGGCVSSSGLQRNAPCSRLSNVLLKEPRSELILSDSLKRRENWKRNASPWTTSCFVIPLTVFCVNFIRLNHNKKRHCFFAFQVLITCVFYVQKKLAVKSCLLWASSPTFAFRLWMTVSYVYYVLIFSLLERKNDHLSWLDHFNNAILESLFS